MTGRGGEWKKGRNRERLARKKRRKGIKGIIKVYGGGRERERLRKGGGNEGVMESKKHEERRK